MENVIKKLRLEFCLIFIWAAVLMGLFEWDVWTAGWAVGNELADYYINLTGIIHGYRIGTYGSENDVV